MSVENIQATSSASQVSGALETKGMNTLYAQTKMSLNPDAQGLFLCHYHFYLMPA